MLSNKKKRAGGLWVFFLILALVSVSLFWQLMGRPSVWFKWGKQDPMTQAIELIRSRYVDNVSVDTLNGLSLEGLTDKLDPHSAYLSPSSLQIANEELAGHFAGIGIEFSRIRDTMTVAYIIPNSPSEKAGLKTGDQLLSIGSSALTGPNLTTDSIRSMVRGPKGTYANLSIRSQGAIRTVSILRADIPTPPVASYYMLNDSIGYIQLTKFSEGSYRSTVKALEELVKKGMRSLILDLRSNGGGFMHEAVELADEFLADDRLIVYTEGAHAKKRNYSCKRPGLFEQGKLMVLMNEFSASASEVLAGALQDWCRATIIGRRSFGKGLVQEQYDLSNGGALRLTVARYYTPLGRCIQRPYEGKREEYLHDVLNRNRNDATGKTKTFFSPCGDTLYAGGGIEPDLLIPIPARSLSQAASYILKSPEIIQWSYRYQIDQEPTLSKLNDIITRAMNPPIDRIQSFFQTVTSPSGIKLELINPQEWREIGFEIYAQIARFRFGVSEYIRIQNLRDPFIENALSAKQN
jgi:carboxyl-terminal processing protease